MGTAADAGEAEQPGDVERREGTSIEASSFGPGSGGGGGRCCRLDSPERVAKQRPAPDEHDAGERVRPITAAGDDGRVQGLGLTRVDRACFQRWMLAYDEPLSG